MTFEQAIDDMQAIITQACSTKNIKVFYEGVAEDRESDNSPFVRVFIRHTGGGQRTLGGKGNRDFGRSGYIMAQIHAPIGNGLQESHQLAKVVVDAFEGNASDNGVWFRRVRVNEVGKDGMFMVTHVLIDFDYTETK